MIKMRSTTSSRRWRRRGHTLIEVLAALAILGTILVGVVLAKADLTRQLAHTQRLSAAVRATDELIATWWTSPRGVPVGETGLTGTEKPLAWRTCLAGNPTVESRGARVVRVEVREVDAEPQVEPLVVVDLVLPDPARERKHADE